MTNSSCICNRSEGACLKERCTVRRHVEEAQRHKEVEKAYKNKMESKSHALRRTTKKLS